MVYQMDIAGKTVLITGGASGLGALYAKAFLEHGAQKIAIADIAVSQGETTKTELNSSYPGKVVFIKCDVSKEEAIEATFKEVLSELGQLDVLVNNAGIMNDSPQAWRKACDVNWQGLVSFTMRAQEHMRKDEGGAGGTIINISSTAALFLFKHLPIYGASKMAVLHFSLSLAEDPFFEETGVRILTICFGPTATPLMQGVQDRSYSTKMGQDLLDIHQRISAGRPEQKPESAVLAFMKMFKEGSNGSVWLSVWDKPVEDITPKISNVYGELMKLI